MPPLRAALACSTHGSLQLYIDAQKMIHHTLHEEARARAHTHTHTQARAPDIGTQALSA